MNEAKLNENKSIMIEKKFVMNEYIEVTIKRDLATLCGDCYHALGWTLMDTKVKMDAITLRLQRDRKIRNRTALTELQRKCEDAFQSIEKLERTKESKAIIISLSVGLVATAIMAGAVFAYLAGWMLLCIVLALPGLIGWGLPVILYKKYLNERIEKINPLIEKCYDTIYEACEKASQLLDV